MMGAPRHGAKGFSPGPVDDELAIITDDAGYTAGGIARTFAKAAGDSSAHRTINAGPPFSICSPGSGTGSPESAGRFDLGKTID